MYRSGARSSGSSHRPKESGGGGPRSGRGSGSSSGPSRRPSPPPSGSSSSRTQARRPRSPLGHRGRRASPSPPRGRRGSPSPPRGRHSSHSPPRGRRAFPPAFRGSTRGESRADFARDGRDHPGDSGSRRRSPGLRSDSLEQSLRITVGNDHFCVGIPERQRRLSDRVGSPVDNLEDSHRDELSKDSVFTRRPQCSRDFDQYISREEGPLSPFLGHQDENFRKRDAYLHRSDYNPRISSNDELLHGAERSRDKLKGSYSTRTEERSREPKRPRYDDTENIHSMGDDHSSFSSGSRNYRHRRRSPSPRFLDPEFRELDLARRKREEEERSRNLSQDLVGVDNGGTSCPIPGLTGVPPSLEPEYSLHRPEEVSVMPKKSILKKRIEVDTEPPSQLESFPCSTSWSQDQSLYAAHPSLPLSGALASFASEVENNDSVLDNALNEPQSNLYQWGPLPGLPEDNSPLRDKFGNFVGHKEKMDTKAEEPEQHTDFLLPHERASLDGSGFSRILSLLADSTSTQEKRRRSFPDIEDEEKFLYGDEEEDLKPELPSMPHGGSESEVLRQKASCVPSLDAPVKRESVEEINPEYAKIHDLLKTIGLDIGVAEISKLAVRTQERLHGKKPIRSLTDRRSSSDRQFSAADRSSADLHFSADQHTSDAHRLESREEHSSNTQPPEVSCPHPVSPVDPYLHRKNIPPLLKSDCTASHIAGSEVIGSGFQPSASSVRCLLPSASSTPVRLVHSASLSQFHMPRTSQFASIRLPPNYQGPTISPASFNAYRHYMAYAASRWPLYPTSQQSNHSLTDPHRLIPVTKQTTRSRPNLRVIPTVTPDKPKQETSLLGPIPIAPVPVRMAIPSLLRYNPEKISDEKNRASQKQKVIEEREKLKSDREARQKKMYYLRTELERLHKQQGEMLRKKRREKDGHKDPLLVEVNRLQENVMKDIAQLRHESEEAEKKQSELDKVAQILGINISDKSEKCSNDNKVPPEKPGKAEKSKSPEKVASSNSSNSKESKLNNENSRIKNPKPSASPQLAAKQSNEPVFAAYEYYDAGNHWCKDCNTICGTMFDFFTHMHNKKHTQTLDPYNRPWASKTHSEAKQDAVKHTEKITVPAKGSEFLFPITGYYCQLCEEFLGDPISGEQHVKGLQHNEKYKKYVDENPLYEERRNLDRQAGLAVVLETERRRQNELKRKLSEKSKDEKKEKKAKVMKDVKENDKVSEELDDHFSEGRHCPEKTVYKRKASIKLQLKEEVKKDSPASFGKFSWKKPEKEGEKGSAMVLNIPKEETVESNKNKEDSKTETGKAKLIKIRLSGKTVVAHTSPWTPVVTTSTQTKIRPNLPIPSTVLRKSGSATVSKPAPLNTFLSIKSSGTTAKPLPVVKESSDELILPPDIISKAFGGEEVILKGPSEEKLVTTEKKEPSHVPEQMLPPLPPPPPPPPPPFPVIPHPVSASAQVNVPLASIKSSPAVSQPHSPDFLGLNILNPVLPAAIMASAQPAVIPSDETAPGVSESDRDQAVFSVLVRPPPPLSSVFSEQAKKLEKRNSCLATANAKDLYDIFYSSGGKGAVETKLSSSSLANGENSSPSEAGSSDTSVTSTLDSCISQEKFTPFGSLDPAPLVSDPEKSVAKTLVSLGKWSVVEHVDSESRDNRYNFLQPLTRLCQSRSYETVTPTTDTVTICTSSSFESDDNRTVSPEVKIGLDLGDPGPPGVEPVPQLLDTHSPPTESHLVETHLLESGNQDEENQELHESKDYRENELETNTELKERGKEISEQIGEATDTKIGPSIKVDSNLNHGTKHLWERETQQPTLQVTDKKAEQPKALMTGSKIQTKVRIEMTAQCLSSSEVQMDFPSETTTLLQNPQDKTVKNAASELLLQPPARLPVCLIDHLKDKEISASSKEWLENSVPESASKTSEYRSLRLKKERSKDLQGKMIHELAICKEKKQGIWESPEKSEALGLRGVRPELTVTVDGKALDFEVTDVKMKELAALRNLGNMGIDFYSTQVENTTCKSPSALSQRVCDENSLSLIGCNPSTLTDFEQVSSSFSEFPLNSPKTLVLNFGTEGERNSSNPRNGKITPNILKTGLPIENVDLGLGSMEGTHQALDLLAGGMIPKDVEGTSQLKKPDAFRLKSETSAGHGPSPCLPDLVDFFTRTSVVQKEKFCSHSEPCDLPECNSPENASIREVTMAQVDRDNNSRLNVGKSLTSSSPTVEQLVGSNVISHAIPAQGATVDAIHDCKEFHVNK